MRTPFAVSALFALVACLPLGAAAADPSVAATVGTTPVAVPIPPGYSEPKSVPQLDQLGTTMTAQSNRLLAFFVSDVDLASAKAGKPPAMERYFMAQTLRAMEGRTLSKSDFAELRKLLRGQYQEMLTKIAPTVQGELDRAAKTVGSQSGNDKLSLKLGEIKGLDIFVDNDTSIGMLALTKISVAGAGKPLEVPLVLSMTTAIAKGKVVYFYAYSRYRSDADSAWVRDQAKAWLPRLASAN